MAISMAPGLAMAVGTKAASDGCVRTARDLEQLEVVPNVAVLKHIFALESSRRVQSAVAPVILFRQVNLFARPGRGEVYVVAVGSRDPELVQSVVRGSDGWSRAVRIPLFAGPRCILVAAACGCYAPGMNEQELEQAGREDAEDRFTRNGRHLFLLLLLLVLRARALSLVAAALDGGKFVWFLLFLFCFPAGLDRKTCVCN
mmetsp:Transcript_86484/g.181090  ORF Transcript_86484/g.181090 Transcript_86484/m.181090 type:complete len:201 (-) Transcript_86484:469-1071(-)